MKRFGLLRILSAAVLLIGLAPSAAISQQPTSTRLAPEEAQRRKVWHIEMAQIPLPKKGCFQASYPNKAWHEVACKPAPPYPQPPRRGPRPLIVGNGDDVSAQAPTGLISMAVGSFDSSTATSETGQINATGPQVANAYTLQLNTNFFSPSTGCAGSPNPGCQGWEQFIFENNGTSGGAFIQYWLLRYNTTCPAGWFTFMFGTDTYCFRNDSMGAAPASNQPVTNLPQMSLTGTVTATSDSVSFFDGTTVSAIAGDNFVGLSTGWTISEFNLVGDGGGGQANFNSGASVVPRTRIIYGGTAPPNCVAQGFTGETNNLSFGPTAPSSSPPGPAVAFTESSAGGAPSDCAAATTIGDTHLDTFRGLFYDFQAAGDFLVAQEGSDFVVQSRQVSGAPTWPNATVNKAIATRMGKTTVALCLAPERLYVDGKIVQLGETNVLSLPAGIDITRKNSDYFITSQSGDSVRATAHPSPGWIDVTVGLGHWPAANVKGILANAGANVNEIAASDGTVLTNPFPFEALYHRYADSWRVAPRESLLAVCGSETEHRIPSQTFYASDLDSQARERTRAVCTAAGVKDAAYLDACTVDVAMIGNDEAARVFVAMPPPVAVGKIVAGTGAGTTGAAGVGHGRYILWLLLLLILIVIIVVWLLLKKR
jgi:hypothetical protein